MVTGLEAISHQSTLTDKFAGLAEAGKVHFTPIPPEKHIKPPEITYSVDELERLTTEELAEMGISVEEVLEKIMQEEAVLSKPEKNSGYEVVMEWVNGYWDAMNKSFEKRLGKSKNTSDVLYADVRLRSAGVKRFLDILPRYTDIETYNQAYAVLVTACEICVLAEVDAGNLNLENYLKAGALSRAVDLGLADPESLDTALELVSSVYTEKPGLSDYFESVVEGIKAEIVVGQMVSNYAFPDVGYDMEFKKPATYRDVTEGADFVLKILDGKNSQELAIFDVKKAKKPGCEGVCRVVVDGNSPKIYERDFEKPSDAELFEIEDNFLRAVVRNKEMGVVIRLPGNLVKGYSIAQLREMDNGGNLDYNEAKSLVYRELGYVLERVGK